jgi:hypothetical protein
MTWCRGAESFDAGGLDNGLAIAGKRESALRARSNALSASRRRVLLGLSALVAATAGGRIAAQQIPAPL